MKTIESKSFLHTCRLNREKVPSFSDYPFSIPTIRSLDELEFHPKVTFFVGENGSGKSTLLEALAVNLGLNPEGGSRNFKFQSRESHSTLHQHLKLAKGIKRPRDLYFLRAESFFNLATEIERLDKEPGGAPIISYYGGVSLHEQSHGESFLAFLQHRVGQGLYLFDEPEAALSPSRQLAFLRILNDRTLEGSQFIIATHSPILLGFPDAIIYSFSNEGIRQIDYRETDHFIVTREFLRNPDRMLKVLFEDEVVEQAEEQQD